jgi:hypothetical protein
MRGASLLSVALLAACRPDPAAAGPADATTTAEDAADEAVARARPWVGAAHTANIDRTALSHDGTMALSHDTIGGVRAWMRLDGTVEPLVVPVTGAISMSIEPHGKDGATVAIVDGSNTLKVFGIDARGKVRELSSGTPFALVGSARLLPGGERVLALFEDMTIRLLTREGEEVGTLPARKLNAKRIEVVDKGRGFVTLGRSSGAISAQRGRIGDGGELELVGPPRACPTAGGDAPGAAAVSADGTRLAVVDSPVSNAWQVLVFALDSEADPRRLQVELPAHVAVTLGFAQGHELLVSGSDGSLAWLFDADEGSRRARPPGPQDFTGGGNEQAMRGGMHVAGHGTWLYVHDLKTLRHRYLGYRATQAMTVALAPGGDRVAWGFSSGPLLVGSLRDGGVDVEIDLDVDHTFGTFRARFVDDERLVAADAQGGIRLVRWETSEVVDEAGVLGGIRDMKYEPTNRLLLVDRHTNDAQVFRVGDEGLEGPWMIADGGFRSGLLRHGVAGHTTAVLWTLDTANALRFYSIKQLRADLTHAEVDDLRNPLKTGDVAPLAIDHVGRRYGVRWNGSAMEIFVDDGKTTRAHTTPAGDVSQLIVADDGSRFVAVHQRGAATTLTAHDGKSLSEQWSYSSGTTSNEVTLSPDGRWLALAGATGAAVLDGETGKAVARRCGVEFTVTGAPPLNAFNGANLPSLCE